MLCSPHLTAAYSGGSHKGEIYEGNAHMKDIDVTKDTFVMCGEPLYNMHQNKDIDKRINGLLSGLEKILTAISEMCNKGSDSHGVGTKRINIAEHHARLFVNSSMTMADFVLSVSERIKKENEIYEKL